MRLTTVLLSLATLGGFIMTAAPVLSAEIAVLKITPSTETVGLGSASAITCGSTTAGSLRYDTGTQEYHYCNGTEWKSLIATTLASSDTLPNAFSFTDLTDQSLSTIITSNTLTITGFDGPVYAEATGSGSPQIRVNGGAWVTSSTINPGDTLQVRQLSSASVSTLRTAVVTVGTGTDNWDVTTRAGQLRIFTTVGTYNGNLGGLSGADSICQTEAGSLGYTGTWKAILSDSTTNAKDRLTLVYPIVRAASTSTVVESSNLWTASLEVAASTSTTESWTGTDSAGMASSFGQCTNWTSASSGVSAAKATPTATNNSWMTSGAPRPCNTINVLYCIEQ